MPALDNRKPSALRQAARFTFQWSVRNQPRPAWKKWGKADSVKPETRILHSQADDVVPFSDSVELKTKSGLPSSARIEVGQDHRLADPEPLKALLRAVEEKA